MSADSEKIRRYIQRLSEFSRPEDWPNRLAPVDEPLSTRAHRAGQISPEIVEQRWRIMGADPSIRAQLLDDFTRQQMSAYAANIESFVGTVKVPVGIAGPLRVLGLHARGDFYIPMATTEAALVASCTRGAMAIGEAGGVTCAVINEGVGRAPMFAFDTVVSAGRFVAWCIEHTPDIASAAQATTRFGKLEDLRFNVEGNHVYMFMEYRTGDAAGQNMVTIASSAACQYIIDNCPIKPIHWFVEGNYSSDKKASYQSLLGVRGKKVVAEVVVPREIVERRLRTTAKAMQEYWHASVLGGVMSGTIGVQGHYANALAALFIACGQDAACVAESAIGVTRFECQKDESLYAAVTLPNMIVGTVGGGTGLPSQNACLKLLGMAGDGNANAFAEIAVGLVLAGELSIIAALSCGDFARAHEELARHRRNS